MRALKPFQSRYLAKRWHGLLACAASEPHQRFLTCAATAASEGQLQAGFAGEPAYELRLYKLPPYSMTSAEASQLHSATVVITRLQEKGHQAYVAGGWVRDRFLGRPAMDVDIATSAGPLEVQKLFSITHALARGTVRVSPETSGTFEVTSFRGDTRVGLVPKGMVKPATGITVDTEEAEVAANTGRKKHGYTTSSAQASVTMALRGDAQKAQEAARRSDPMYSAYLDAAMRDFSINSLYYDPVADRVLDFVGGVEDIHNHVLRLNRTPQAYLDPLSRQHYMLQDDPVRVLRAVRFLVTLPGGFKCDQQTIGHLKAYAPQCSTVNGSVGPHRLFNELEKMVKAGSFACGMLEAQELGMMTHLFPFLAQQHPNLQLHCGLVSTRGSCCRLPQTQAATQRGLAALARLDPTTPVELQIAALIKPAARPSSNPATKYDDLYRPILKTLPSGKYGAQVKLIDTLSTVVQLVSTGRTGQQEWVAAYAMEGCRESLQVLAAWMEPQLAKRLMAYHDQCMVQWQNEILAVRKALQIGTLNHRDNPRAFRGVVQPPMKWASTQDTTGA